MTTASDVSLRIRQLLAVVMFLVLCSWLGRRPFLAGLAIVFVAMVTHNPNIDGTDNFIKVFGQIITIKAQERLNQNAKC